MHRTAASLILIPLIALPGAAPVWAAGTHMVAIRISDGRRNYSQKIQISEGSQAQERVPADAGKQMFFNGQLTADENGMMDLQYQLELSGDPGGEGPTIQGQGELYIRPGDELPVIKCGLWTVTLALDPGTAGKKPAGGRWNPPGLANYRLTADMNAGSSKEKCVLLSKAGAQTNIVDGQSKGGRQFGFILDSLFTTAGPGGAFVLQYTTGLGSGPASGDVRTDGETPLALNRKKALAGKGYRLEFLLEPPAGAKPAAGGGKKDATKSGPAR